MSEVKGTPLNCLPVNTGRQGESHHEPFILEDLYDSMSTRLLTITISQKDIVRLSAQRVQEYSMNMVPTYIPIYIPI